MSLTNKQITAQNFKDFYDRIRPLLNSQHYHVDRSGQELKTLYAKLDSDWTVSANQKIPFIKKSGTIIQSSNGSFTIPNGTRIELLVSISHKASSGATQPDVIYSIYNDSDSSYISTLNSIDPFQYNEYSHSNVLAIQWTNDLGHDVDISIRPTNSSNAFVRALFSSLTIKEIGRIVDPIQYTANNDELEETPVGNIISYMGNSVPKHHLACDGTEYAIGTYPELEAHIIDEFGSINYFGGDGTTTWAVPDLNGEFLRGTGTNSHTNQGNGANVGVHQDSTEFPAYYTGIGNDNKYYIGYRVPNNVTSSDYNIIGKADKNISKTSTSIYGNSKEDLHGTASTSNVLSTVRPTNTSVKFCIKYESTYHVIVPSHMYKVSIAGSISTGSGDAQYTFDSSDIIGDASLVSGNSFVAPVDGFYVIGMDVTNKGSTSTYTFIKVNGVDREFVTSSGSTHSLYLNKGDVITIWQHGNTASHINSGRLSFCLLTANYKDNIIAGGEVYSEEEQLVGTSTDGRPLYQKTFITTLPSANADKDLDIGASVQDGWVYTAYVHGDYNASMMDDYWYVYIGKNNSTTPNKIRIHNSLAGWADLPVTVTVQYTKTTDQANTYQYKNSLLLTRPDMWEPNTEYDFGGGLYGQRFTGNMPTIAAGNVATRVFQYTISSSATLVSCGGCITGKNLSEDRIVIAPNSVRRAQQDNATLAMGWSSVLILGDILLMNVGSYARDHFTTSDTYDIWVTYKK